MNEVSRRTALTALAGWAGAAIVAPLLSRAATPIADPLERPALQSLRAVDAVLLGIVLAGDRLVALGERGVVLLSDDRGVSWRQAVVPVSATLTAACFATPKNGIALGHAGVVLQTRDGGQTWERRLDGLAVAQLVATAARTRVADDGAKRLADAERLVADGADKPLLDVAFGDASNGWAVGAYGLILRTQDGGESWASFVEHIDNPKGLHMNAVAIHGTTLVIAGEQGQIWRSDDGGAHFSNLTSPYEGSWFSVLVLESGRIVIGGLRGNVWYSDDQGASFKRSMVPAPVTLSSLTILTGGAMFALNQAGQAFISKDQGMTFQFAALPPGAPLTALVQVDDKTLVGASLRGPRRLPLPPGLVAVAAG